MLIQAATVTGGVAADKLTAIASVWIWLTVTAVFLVSAALFYVPGRMWRRIFKANARETRRNPWFKSMNDIDDPEFFTPSPKELEIGMSSVSENKPDKPPLRTPVKRLQWSLRKWLLD